MIALLVADLNPLLQSAKEDVERCPLVRTDRLHRPLTLNGQRATPVDEWARLRTGTQKLASPAVAAPGDDKDPLSWSQCR